MLPAERDIANNPILINRVNGKIEIINKELKNNFFLLGNLLRKITEIIKGYIKEEIISSFRPAGNQ